MDGDSTYHGHQGTTHNTKRGECTEAAINSRGTPHPETKTDGMSLVWQQLQDRRTSLPCTGIIMASWRPATAKQYRPQVNRLLQFYHRWCISPINPTITDIVNFCSDTFHRGIGYESLNTIREELSSLEIVVDG